MISSLYGFTIRSFGKPLKNLLRNKLQYKLFLLCLFLVFIPIVLLGTILIGRITQAAVGQEIDNSINSVYLINENLKNYIKVAEEISDSIYTNSTVRKELGRDYWEVEDFMRLYNETVYPVTIHKRYIYRFIHAIQIYMDNESLIYNGDELIYATDEIKQQAWYMNALANKGTKQWDDSVTAEGTGNRELKTISLYRSLISIDNKPFGVLRISIRQRYLYDLINQENDGKVRLIVNNYGNVVASSNEGIIGGDVKNSGLLDGIYQGQTGLYDALYEGREFKVIYNTCVTTSSYIHRNWKVIMIIPADSFFKEAGNVKKYGLLICILVLAVMAVFTFILSKGITLRIKKLVEKTHKVAEGNFTETVEVSGSDEIAELGESFNKMVRNLNELINQVYESKIKMQHYELKKKEAEINALQNQINPHFLYNTLDTIRMHAIINDNETLADMLVSLSSLLRYSISRGREIATVSDEIGHVANYVNIINMKYNNRIKLHVDIPDELHSCRILKLVMQPIVENAFQHGILGKKREGNIKIGGYAIDASTLVIEVKDDGEGIPDERLEQINKSLEGIAGSEEAASGSIGLNNVNSRIKLYFGLKYGLKLSSTYGEGTVVKVCLPMEKGV